MKTNTLFEQRPTGATYDVLVRDKDCDVAFTHTDVLTIKKQGEYILLATRDSMEFLPVGTMFTVRDGVADEPRYSTESSNEMNINDMVIETPAGEGSIIDVMAALAPFMGNTPQGD